ncbi:MAG: 3-deoxy-7-phosphoheptulonate synthase, partial [Terriglobales bacterium]
MLLVMRVDATEAQVAAVCSHVEALGLRAHPIPGAQRTAIGITGNHGSIELSDLEDLPGVAEAIRVSKPYKLVGREMKPEPTLVQVGPVVIGGPKLVVMAGPCAVESREQLFRVAEVVHATGAQMMRGGA